MLTRTDHAEIWRKVSDAMEKHAEKPDIKPSSVDQLASLSLFAWEVSFAYRTHNQS